jgi:hypothetical protein
MACDPPEALCLDPEYRTIRVPKSSSVCRDDIVAIALRGERKESAPMH